MLTMSEPMETIVKNQLIVQVYKTRDGMGVSAANWTAQLMRRLLKRKRTVRMVFAAAPSQNELLKALTAERDIDWARVEAFHMDEYIGLPANHPARFSRYLNEHLFELVTPGVVHLMNPEGDGQAECERYASMLAEKPIDIVCLGIGENGHIAFNDPPVANFHDPVLMKSVELDDSCRLQQVHDGCFPDLESVPTHAVTLTIPALMSAKHLVCVVPGAQKSAAVDTALNGSIDIECPASILRTHNDCRLFLDNDAYRSNVVGEK